MALADAYRWAGPWGSLRETVESAIGVADEIGDLDLVARAASAMRIGALWQSAHYGSTHPVVVAALRRCVHRAAGRLGPGNEQLDQLGVSVGVMV
jgi:hypothetical protein